MPYSAGERAIVFISGIPSEGPFERLDAGWAQILTEVMERPGVRGNLSTLKPSEIERYGSYLHFFQQQGRPVYFFRYSFLASVADNAARLERFISDLQRVKELKIKTFTFIAHSVGSAVLVAYLNSLDGCGAPSLVSEQIEGLVYVAPVFKGTLELVKALVLREATFGALPRAKRWALRNRPGVLELLPAYDNAAINGPDRWPNEIADWPSGIQEWDEKENSSNMSTALQSAEASRAQYLRLPGTEFLSRSVALVWSAEPTLGQVTIVEERGGWKQFIDFTNPGKLSSGDGWVPLASSAAFGGLEPDKNLINVGLSAARQLGVSNGSTNGSVHDWVFSDERVRAITRTFLDDLTNGKAWNEFKDPKELDRKLSELVSDGSARFLPWPLGGGASERAPLPECRYSARPPSISPGPGWPISPQAQGSKELDGPIEGPIEVQGVAKPMQKPLETRSVGEERGR